MLSKQHTRAQGLSLRKEKPPETVTRKLERTHAEVRRASAGGRVITWRPPSPRTFNSPPNGKRRTNSEGLGKRELS
jgi:hypothetical protein